MIKKDRARCRRSGCSQMETIVKSNGYLFNDEPVINQYEAKNGTIWRVAANTTNEQVSDKEAVPLKNIINLTGKYGYRRKFKLDSTSQVIG